MKFLEPEYEHSDERRVLSQLLTCDIKQINQYHANKGAILGNHFHKETHEYFFITKGTFMVTIVSPSVRMKFPVNKGDFFVVHPYENHTLKVISPKASMLTFLTKEYTKENPDIWKE